MNFKISFYKIRKSCICFVINEAITNNSKYILVTYKHCFTWTLTSPPAFIFSVKINIFIIQPYAVKFSHHLVSHFPGQTFQCPRASIEVELYHSAFPMWCGRNNVQWNYSVSSAWEAKLNIPRFQWVFDICSFFSQSWKLHYLFIPLCIFIWKIHINIQNSFQIDTVR